LIKKSKIQSIKKEEEDDISIKSSKEVEATKNVFDIIDNSSNNANKNIDKKIEKNGENNYNSKHISDEVKEKINIKYDNSNKSKNKVIDKLKKQELNSCNINIDENTKYENQIFKTFNDGLSNEKIEQNGLINDNLKLENKNKICSKINSSGEIKNSLSKIVVSEKKNKNTLLECNSSSGHPLYSRKRVKTPQNNKKKRYVGNRIDYEILTFWAFGLGAVDDYICLNCGHVY